MKNVTVESFFKKVSIGAAAKDASLASKVGQKRPDIKWSFSGFEKEEDLAHLNPEQVCFFLNQAIESYGRSLIAEKNSDWDFIPASETLTLEAAYVAATTKASRERTLTKETAGEFAKFYAAHAASLLGIPEAAAKAAAAVLSSWMTYAKDEKVRAAMFARLNQLVAALGELDEDSEVLADFASAKCDLSAVLESLIKAFSEKEVETISADAL